MPDHLPQLQALVERRYRKDITAPTQNALGHVLLTGATGFLGAYLINELQGYADKVTCIGEVMTWLRHDTNYKRI